MRALVIGLALLAVAGCSRISDMTGMSVAEQITMVCESITSTYEILDSMEQAGNTRVTAILDQADVYAVPVCTAETPPDTYQALQILTRMAYDMAFEKTAHSEGQLE